MLPETFGGLVKPRAGAVEPGADRQRQALIEDRQPAFVQLALNRVLRQPAHAVAIEDHALEQLAHGRDKGEREGNLRSAVDHLVHLAPHIAVVGVFHQRQHAAM